MEGMVVGEKYQVGRKLRAQRFYDVFEGHNLDIGNPVLFCVVRKDFVDRGRTFGALRPNLAVVASLTHAGILKLKDFGEVGETIFLVNEFIEGSLLSDLISPTAQIETLQSLNQAIKVVEAVGAAHSRGVVHGLLTPESVYVGYEQSVKVTDFYYLYSLSEELKTAVEFQGRDIVYCAPEVISGGRPGFPSDVYSLGVMLYEMLTGRQPFQKDGALAVALEKELMGIRKPREINPDIPQLLETVIMKCIKKDPSARYEDAGKLAAELHLCRSSLARSMNENGAGPGAGAGSDTDVQNGSMANWAAKDRSEKIDELRNRHGESGWKPSPAPEQESVEDYYDMSDDTDTRAASSRKRGKLPQGFIPFLVSLFILISIGIFGYQSLKSFLAPNTGAGTVVVPSVANLSIVEAKAQLASAGLIPEVTSQQNSSNIAEGYVISQNPPEGSKVKQGRTVEMILSAGEKKVGVPKVIGLTVEDATIILEKAGFVIGEQREEFNENTDTGFVIGQTPEPDEEKYIGASITLYVSKGKTPRLITMPRVTGLSVNEARSILEMNDIMNVNVVRMETGAALTDYVVAQNILEGVRVDPDRKVTLYAASPPENTSFVETRGAINMTISTENQWQEVVVMVYDQDTGREVYRQLHKTGDKVSVTVTGYGKTNIKVYLDGILAKEQTL